MISAIDKKLDMIFSMAIPIDSYVLSTIIKETLVPINVYRHKKETYITFFLNHVSPNERVLLAPLNPVIVGDALEITEKIENPVGRTFIENADILPTLTSGELYTKGKSVFASFRFHSSQLKEAGKLLRLLVSLNEDIDEIQLTKSEGISKILNEIDNRIPLSVVTFSFSKSSDKKFVLEWSNAPKDLYGGILYDLGDDNPVSCHDMSKEDTAAFLKAVSKDHIPLASYLEFHDLKRVSSTVHLPSFLLKPFLVRLYESSESLEDFEINSIEKYCSKRIQS